jgi:polyhydroxyalkanoate synthase
MSDNKTLTDIAKNFFDFKQSYDDFVNSQEKILKGMETMMKVEATGSNMTEREIVYQEDKLTLYHYKKRARYPSKVPTLIIYALINTPAMMDLQQDKSFIKNMLDGGADLYLIEWGYPTLDDHYLTLEDYIEGYINNCVDFIRAETGLDKINLLGVCQGGTFSAIYSALHPDKVNSLVTMVTPIDYAPNDGLLWKWSKFLNADSMVDAYKVIPGDFMNTGFLTLRPLSLMVNKYLDLINDLDDEDSMNNFLRMERWIFDSPGQAGEAFRQVINDLFKGNKLVKGELMIGDKKVDLKNVVMPVLNVYAERDNQVPNSSSAPLEKYVGSKDVTSHCFPTGHIGMFVSSRSQKEVAPMISKWLKERSK